MAEPKTSGPTKAKKVITPQGSCQDGKHTFIVTVWQVTGNAKKALHMKCQHCLMPIELNETSKDWVVSREWLKETNNGA
jgi:hypothetical protein